MYTYTTTAPIIKAFGKKKKIELVFIFPKLQSQDIDCYTIMKQRQGQG